MSEMRDRINLLGRRNSSSEGFEIGNHTSFLRNKERKPELRMWRGERHAMSGEDK